MHFTEYATLEACPRKYQYIYELGLKPPERPAIEEGIAFHAMMEKIGQCQMRGEHLDWESFTEVNPVLKEAAQLWLAERTDWRWLFTELSLKTQIFKTLLEGRVDAIVERPDGLWVVDYKTVSRLDASWAHVADVHLQFQIYLELANSVQNSPEILEALDNRPIKGLLMEVFHRRNGSFYELEILTSDLKRNEMLCDIQSSIEARERYQEQGYWPKRTTSCNMFGGCEFLSLCGAKTLLDRTLIFESMKLESENVDAK